MKKILENAEKHLDFLKETDDSGYTVSERILMPFFQKYSLLCRTGRKRIKDRLGCAQGTGAGTSLEYGTKD